MAASRPEARAQQLTRVAARPAMGAQLFVRNGFQRDSGQRDKGPESIKPSERGTGGQHHRYKRQGAGPGHERRHVVNAEEVHGLPEDAGSGLDLFIAPVNMTETAPAAIPVAGQPHRVERDQPDRQRHATRITIAESEKADGHAAGRDGPVSVVHGRVSSNEAREIHDDGRRTRSRQQLQYDMAGREQRCGDTDGDGNAIDARHDEPVAGRCLVQCMRVFHNRLASMDQARLSPSRASRARIISGFRADPRYGRADLRAGTAWR